MCSGSTRTQALFCATLVALAGLAGGCIGFSGGVETTQRARSVDLSPAADPALVNVRQKILHGDGDNAFEDLVDWFKANSPAAEGYDQALYLAALALIEDGKRIKAFYYLEELLDEHAGSSYYQPAVRLQYAIAESYLEGKADRVLIFPERHYDEAIEMLFRIQLRLPGSELAEKALLRTADFYFDRGDYDFAEDAYFVFTERFPRSSRIPLVRLKQAFSNVRQYRGPAYDPTPLIDARTQLAQFRADYPGLARDRNIPQILDWIDEQFAEKLLIQARYYARTRAPEAEQRLLAAVLERHPDTEASETARRWLDRKATAGTTRPADRLPPVVEPIHPGGEG